MHYLKVLVAGLFLLALVFGTVAAFSAEMPIPPPNAIGGIVLYECHKPIAVEWIMQDPINGSVGLLTVSPEYKKFTEMVGQASLILPHVELKPDCTET